MIPVRWTPQADDLQSIYDFIARDSPHYAQLTIENILAAIDLLEQHPLMGRHLRELIKSPYRIVYRVEEIVKILTVFRASRLFPENLK